ncbi:hypothetical protein [Lacinutrix sp. 5H-3-7-4]|uniref:hypothetical protein n=1 Tax=Lacinutrix sp. (strain 5H-3-7-4) TaxID=983544 RepID=UPI00020A3431|nr:hypothetical protein [Lacinutrix sp. 5H-3-7-4]AEH01785.1 hypothetical protein Lacal_1939 [Lacinutrix sp. 5H-3-7-4]
MVLENYIAYFKDLKTESINKKELNIYNAYINLFTDLKLRILSTEDLALIENKIELLDLADTTSRKDLNKKLQELLKFLETNFGLIPEKHYETSYMGIGMCFGMLANLVFGVVSLVIGLVIGMCIGLFIGSQKDKKAKEDGLVLDYKSPYSF